MKHRSLIIGILAGIVSVLFILMADAGDYAMYGSVTNSIKIAPERNSQAVISWTASTSVDQGVLRGSNGKQYMAISAGTTGTNAPSHFGGTVSDGSVSWLRVPSGSRKELLIVQEDSGAVWYTDSSSTTNGGAFTYIKGQSYSDDTDAAVYVYVTNSIKFNVKDR